MPDLSHKYLRVQDLRRLRNLLFSARRPVEGRYAGRHVSPQRGQSVEFTDYRQYTPGDQIGDIDWKVYGRSDKLFIKLFEHQSDMPVHLVVDASASMGYQGISGSRVSRFRLGSSNSKPETQKPQPSKFDHACRMAAAIAFLTTRQQDRVSLGIARDGLIEFHRPRSSPSHLLAILRAMERVQPAGEARLAAALSDLASRIPRGRGRSRGGLLVVLSDLLDEPDPLLRAMSLFAHHGGEVVVFHVMHPDELKLPELDDAIFTDSETGGRLSLKVPDVREAYEQRVRQFLDGWSSGCRKRGFDYQLVDTADPYHQSLERFLFTRASAS